MAMTGSLLPAMGTPDRPETDLTTTSRERVRLTRAYTAELLDQEGSRAANDNVGERERLLAGYLRRFEDREARRPLPSFRGYGRRFLPLEVRGARRRVYVIGGVILTLCVVAVVGSLLALGQI